MDIAGSQGAQFVYMGQRQDYLTRTVTVEPSSEIEIGQLHLYGDWDLKTRFTYKIKQVTRGEAQAFKNFIKHYETSNLDNHVQEKISIEQKLQDFNQIFKTFDLSTNQIPDIQDLLLKHKLESLIDTDFPPLLTSLCDPDETYPFKSLVTWQRVGEVFKGKPLFGHQIKSDFIQSNQLDNSSFLAAISFISEVQGLVKRLFVYDGSKSQSGVYRIKVFSRGLVENITIDDYIPVSAESNQPMFASCKDGTLWLPLLEKAFAKMYGTYYDLTTGSIQDYLYNLTGCPIETFDFSDPSARELIETNKLHDFIIELERKGCLIGFQASQTQALETGLINTSVYSVLEIKTNEEGTEFYLLRNQSYKKQPVNSELIKLNQATSTFWIQSQQVSFYFTRMIVAHVDEWEEIRVKGAFQTLRCEQNFTFNDQVISQHAYYVTVKKSQIFHITVYQDEKRNLNHFQNNLSVCLAVCKKDETNCLELIDLKEFSQKRQNHLQTQLEPGEYIFLPIASGCVNKQQVLDQNLQSQTRLLKLDGSLNQIVYKALDKLFDSYCSVQPSPWLYTDDLITILQLGFSEQWSKVKLKSLIKERFCTNDDFQLTRKGFKQFFRHMIESKGENESFKALKQLGFDKQFVISGYRNFGFVIQSDSVIDLKIEEQASNNLNVETNYAILLNHGQVVESESGIYELIVKKHEETYTFQYGVRNLSIDQPYIFTLNCSQSQNMAFSERSGFVAKILQPGQLVYMMNIEALPDAETFSLGVKVSWQK